MYQLSTDAAPQATRICMSALCPASRVAGTGRGRTSGSSVFGGSIDEAAKAAPQGIAAWSPPA
jgi:hypothetical protein